LAPCSESVEGVGGGLVDRHRTGIGARCRGLTGVDLQGFETVALAHGLAPWVWGGDLSDENPVRPGRSGIERG
jgi:hypothetical protein